MDNRHFALEGLDLTGKRILEIGPLNRPLVEKSDDRTVFYADHCSTETLKEKYSADPSVPNDDICKVDIDISKQTIAEASEKFGQFDIIVASHVIEHVPNLVGWLSELTGALKVGGIIALTIPDKRYTFDFFRRETSFWMVEEAFNENRHRPSEDQVLDYFVTTVSADCKMLWADPDHSKQLKRATDNDVALHWLNAHRQGMYVDCHCWIFTNNSFLELLREIVVHYNLSIDLKMFRETKQDQLDFHAQFIKVAPETKPSDWDKYFAP
ncbi:MAG: methyltransferase domain-containing protein [Lentilitoribacter sp.]